MSLATRKTDHLQLKPLFDPDKKRGGVGWGVLTFLLQLGFHVNSFPAQSMVDSHMLAAQLTGLGGELQSCEKKTKPVAENSFK